MDDQIQVCAVYEDAVVQIYGVQKQGVRPLLEQKQFSSYGKAVQFAQEFEALQRAEPKNRRR